MSTLIQLRLFSVPQVVMDIEYRISFYFINREVQIDGKINALYHHDKWT